MNIEKIEKENFRIRGMEWLLSKLAEECCEFSSAYLQYKNKFDYLDHKKTLKLYNDMISELVDVKIGINHILTNLKDETTLFLIKEREKNKYKQIAKKIKELNNDLL